MMIPKKGFTLIELLVVVAIIGVLATIVISSLSTARAKARDAQRKVEIKNIMTALNLYYLDHETLPRTSHYGESNAGGWDYSSQGGFLTFLENEGYMDKVPVDPINDMPGDSTSGTYAYSYYCYNSSSPSKGLVLRYRLEETGNTWHYASRSSPSTGADPSFKCS